MTYNEYAQVLESVNPDTGELYQPEDLNVIDWNDVGTAMLQDAIWASTERLEDDSDRARVLRSVLMKPEHEDAVDWLVARLASLATTGR